MDAAERKIIEAVIVNLTSSPQNWKRDKYKATHRDGVSVWTGSGHAFLEIKSAHGGYTIGGANIIGRLVPWRRRLWHAVISVPFDQTMQQAFRPFAGNGGPL